MILAKLNYTRFKVFKFIIITFLKFTPQIGKRVTQTIKIQVNYIFLSIKNSSAASMNSQPISDVSISFLQDYIEINNSGYMINQKNQLGGGKFGKVYQGYSKIHKMKIAVKKIPQMGDNGTNNSSEFKRQIDILKQISSQNNGHKNICKYYHYEDYQNFFYIFIEYCGKGNLRQYVNKKRNQISEKQYVRILKSIVEGMIYLNKNFVIHRDIKPLNILVDDNDQIKIGDFGISRQMPLRNQALTNGQCTVLYGSPQILKQDEYNQTCDVWSCGLTMYQLMEGKSIYQDFRPSSKNDIIKIIKKFQQKEDFVYFSNPNITENFRKLLRKMITVDPNKRPAFQQIQKSQQYQSLLIFYNLGTTLTTRPIISDFPQIEYDPQQKQKYLRILKNYLKYKKDKLSILLSLQHKFMNKPFQVLWNVQKYILKYLTLNMYLIKAQQYSNWLHVSLNDNIIDLQGQLKIKISQFRLNYRIFSQLMREQKKKIDFQIKKYHKLILTQANKIQFQYLQRPKEYQRIKSYMDLKLLEQLFSYTRKSTSLNFQVYHKIFKSLIELKEYYLTYEQVEVLPTFQDKEIYLHILMIYHMNKFFNQQRYISEIIIQQKIQNKQKAIQTPSILNKNSKNSRQQSQNMKIFSKILQSSTTTTLNESISDFKQRMSNQKELMKWIFRHNLSRKVVFENNKQLKCKITTENSEQEGKISLKGSIKDLNIQPQNSKKLWQNDQYSRLSRKQSSGLKQSGTQRRSISSIGSRKNEQLQVNKYNHLTEPQFIPTSDRRLQPS